MGLGFEVFFIDFYHKPYYRKAAWELKIASSDSYGPAVSGRCFAAASDRPAFAAAAAALTYQNLLFAGSDYTPQYGINKDPTKK